MNEIQTVKIQGQSYLLNGIMSVPKADGNREYELIKQWLSEGNIPEPEFTDEEIEAEKRRQFEIQFRFDRDSLLQKTDIEINKAEDLGEDSKALRTYRQALRDATVTWTIPEGIL